MNHTVYLIFNKLTGKSYAGITSSKNPYRRWASHKACAKANGSGSRKLHNSIRKHGSENFTFEPIMTAENGEAALKLERLLIQSLDLCNTGYNLAPEGNLASEKGKASQRMKLRGNQNAAGERDAIFAGKMSDAHRPCVAYKLLSPEGQEYVVKNLNAFAREYKLHPANLANRGKSQGWTLTRIY